TCRRGGGVPPTGRRTHDLRYDDESARRARSAALDAHEIKAGCSGASRLVVAVPAQAVRPGGKPRAVPHVGHTTARHVEHRHARDATRAELERDLRAR